MGGGEIMTTLWSGHVTISADEQGRNVITYRAYADLADKTYAPHGFFETHAVQGLVKKLTGTPEIPENSEQEKP